MTRDVHAKYPIELLSLKSQRLRHWRRIIPVIILIVPSALIMTVIYLLPLSDRLYNTLLDVVLILAAYVLGKLADQFTNSAKERFFYGPMIEQEFNKLTQPRYTITKDDAEMLLTSKALIDFEDILEGTLDEMPDFVEFGSVVKNVDQHRIRVTLLFDKRVGFYVLERKIRFQRRFRNPPRPHRVGLAGLLEAAKR